MAAAVAAALVVTADLLRPRNPGVGQTLGQLALVSVPLLAAEALRARRSYVLLLTERLATASRR